jgi:hypothetical protein
VVSGGVVVGGEWTRRVIARVASRKSCREELACWRAGVLADWRRSHEPV